MKPKAPKPVTVFALVVLAAYAVLSLLRTPLPASDAETTTRKQPEEAGVSRSELARRLRQSARSEGGDGRPNGPRARVVRALKKRGIEPGTDSYKRALERRISEHRAAARELHNERVANRRLREGLENRKDVWLRTNGNNNLENEVKEAEVMMENRIVELQRQDEENQPLTVCGRAADVGDAEDLLFLQQYSQCPEITQSKPVILLSGLAKMAHGRTGNNLIELLHAIQYARDEDMQLGIMYHSWAMDLILEMWMSVQSDDWEAQLERALCLKVFHTDDELQEYDLVNKTTFELFVYNSQRPLGEYMASQEHSLRTLFRSYNTGGGDDADHKGAVPRDMCSGIDAVFGIDQRRHVIYSVIHDRNLAEENGGQVLRRVAQASGCDPEAALHMEPDYVKSILRPLGMIGRPIVVITDGQNFPLLRRLLTDEEIGQSIRVVPEEACWVGGDMTLGIMSNVFIGNPASSFAGFIAKSRLALGFGHSYLFRARNENGVWKTVCGDSCIFDRTIMGSMS